MREKKKEKNSNKCFMYVKQTERVNTDLYAAIAAAYVILYITKAWGQGRRSS